METRPTQNSIAATINELATFIRKNAPISFGQMCLQKHIAPSTLYGWKHVLLDVCPDIICKHGIFDVERHHDIPTGRLVRVERKGGV